MTRTTLSFSFVLILLGLLSYFLTDRVSITALIPSFFGFALLLSAIVAQNKSLHKHAMHTSVLIALLGFLGTASAILKIIQYFLGSPLNHPEATLAKGIMALICIIYVILSVRWFLRNRRERKMSA